MTSLNKKGQKSSINNPKNKSCSLRSQSCKTRLFEWKVSFYCLFDGQSSHDHISLWFPTPDVRTVHAFARPAGEAPDVAKRIAIPVVAFMVSVKMAHVFVWPDGMGFIVPLRDVPMGAPIMAAVKLISEENGAAIVILDGRVLIVAFDWRLVVTMDMTMTKVS